MLRRVLRESRIAARCPFDHAPERQPEQFPVRARKKFGALALLAQQFEPSWLNWDVCRFRTWTLPGNTRKLIDRRRVRQVPKQCGFMTASGPHRAWCVTEIRPVVYH